jgi:hypothetical protein
MKFRSVFCASRVSPHGRLARHLFQIRQQSLKIQALPSFAKGADCKAPAPWPGLSIPGCLPDPFGQIYSSTKPTAGSGRIRTIGRYALRALQYLHRTRIVYFSSA